MNLRAVAWLLGCVMLLLAGFMLVPAGLAFLFRESEAQQAFLISAALTGLVGVLLAWRNRGSTLTHDGHLDYFRREGLATVGLAWVFSGVAGALPYLFAGVLSSPIDAFFESVSGFTTTGSTILTLGDFRSLPQSMAFWRSFTHWLGGIGIVLVFVVLFPTGGRSLFRSEVPGIAREAMTQRVRDSAIALVRVYVLLTGIETVLLWLCDMTFFDAVLHAFGTIATGGFSNHPESVAAFSSWSVELVIVLFMFAAGINFGYYDSLIRAGAKRAWKSLLGSGEVRAYAALMAGSTLVITGFLWFWGGSNGVPLEGEASPLPDYSSFLRCLRDASFSVVSMQTSTGFGTADFERWPEVCRALLLLLAMVGACAGSTGGGIKVVRILILAKAALRGVERFSRPRAIHNVRLDRETLDEPTVGAVSSYVGLWLFVFVAGTLVLCALDTELDLVTASTAVLATLNNIGPGLGLVGPTDNFAELPEVAKLLLTSFMILGRLEFYAVVVLFVPSFWRH